MPAPNSVIGWKLDRAQRAELLRRFPPKFGNIVADHVTLAANVPDDTPLPGEEIGEVIARADDDRGVEAMVVRIKGSTDRPGGGTYHITWSLADGRRAKESNSMLAAHAWSAYDRPIQIQLIPARIR